MIDPNVLDERLTALEGDLVELTQALVRIDTVNPYSGDKKAPGEGKGQKYIEKYFKKMGAAKIEVFEPEEGIYARMGVRGPKERRFDGRPNVVARFAFERPGPSFLFNGHMDTVGAEGMTIDPWSGELKGGRIWGRGSADQKGLLAAAVIATKALLGFQDELCGELIVMSVVDEECNGAGAGTLACVERGIRADAGLLTDGFDYKLCREANGLITPEIFVQGESGHCSSPQDAVSAIDKTILVKQGVDRFIRARAKKFPALPINLGVMRSGVLPGTVPNDGYLALNVEYALEEADAANPNGESVKQELIAALREEIEAAGDAWLKEHPPRVELLKDFPPLSVPGKTRVVQDALAAAKEVLGPEVTFQRFIPTCDGGHLYLRGRVPMVFFGTAELAQCHTPHESVAVNDLMAALRVYARVAARQLSR